MNKLWAGLCLFSASDGVELIEHAPIPPTSGWSNLRWRPRKRVHLHWDPPGAQGSNMDLCIKPVLETLEAQLDEFRAFRRRATFLIACGGSYDDRLETFLSTHDLSVLTALRLALDFDLFWSGDEAVEELGEIFVGGALQVTGRGWSDPWQWDDIEHGRIINRVLRAHPEQDQEITFRTVGGYGRPMSHFSANALRLLVSNRCSLRLIIEPGWPLLRLFPPTGAATDSTSSSNMS